MIGRHLNHFSRTRILITILAFADLIEQELAEAGRASHLFIVRLAADAIPPARGCSLLIRVPIHIVWIFAIMSSIVPRHRPKLQNLN